jgi:glycosyltransferase involved in cell wall biosynthesis
VTTSTARTAPLKVCIVAPSLDILGGQAVVAQRLMGKLAEDPDIELSFIPHNPRLPGLLRLLQRVKYVRTVATSLAYAMLLLKRLRTQDVVHVFSASYWSFLLAPTPAVLIGKWYGKRVIVNYRSGEAEDHLTRWPGALRVLRRADAIVVPSGYLVDVFAKFGLKATSIFNFVDTDRIPYRERTELTPHFLANRNFAPHYNVSCVLRAFQLIQHEVPSSKLTVVGDGEERSLLHDLARQLQLRNVKFVGQVSPAEMARLYDESDIYLNSPNVDNMPNSVIEAFAAGLPVVTTSAGGIPYIVTHSDTGLMSAPGDHESLARNALTMLTAPGLAQRVAGRARQELQSRYTWPAVHERWRHAYGLSRQSPVQPS